MAQQFQGTNAFRLINSSADGFSGVTVDNLAGALLVECHRSDVDIGELLDGLSDFFGDSTAIFVKERWLADKNKGNGIQVRGESIDNNLIIEEARLKFALNLCEGEHIGLFLDARPVRERVREISTGRRVLNLFSYTGGFGVAAAAAGARCTTNIDNKRSALDIAKQNYILNDLSFDTRSFYKIDVFKYLPSAQKGKAKFDLIILDPPPRSKRPGGRTFTARNGYASLAARCMKLIDIGGILLAGLNALTVNDERFEQMINEAAKLADKSIIIEKVIVAGVDFPPSPDRPTARFFEVLLLD